MRDTTIHISSNNPSLSENLRFLFRYKALFFMMAKRMMLVRYRETILGWGWLFILTILPVVLSTFVFGKVMNVQTKGVPYAVFFLAGNSVWNFVASGARLAARGIRAQRSLIKNTAFPIAIIPISYHMVPVIEFIVNMLFLFVLIICYAVNTGKWYFNNSLNIFLAPLFLLGPLVAGIALSMFSSILNYIARDIRMIVPRIFQIWFFVTPIIYPLDNIPPKYLWIVYLNPMTFFIEGFRACLLGYGSINPVGLFYDSVVLIVLFFVALRFFFGSYRTIIEMA